MWNDKFVNELELPMGAWLRSMTNVKQRVDGLWSQRRACVGPNGNIWCCGHKVGFRWITLQPVCECVWVKPLLSNKIHLQRIFICLPLTMRCVLHLFEMSQILPNCHTCNLRVKPAWIVLWSRFSGIMQPQEGSVVLWNILLCLLDFCGAERQNWKRSRKDCRWDGCLATVSFLNNGIINALTLIKADMWRNFALR